MIELVKEIKNRLGYICFILVLAVLLTLYVLNLNPGHLYIGPSGTAACNQQTDRLVSDQAGWQTEFVSTGDKLWGVSVRFQLSEQDERNNIRRTSRELVNVKKDTESPASEIPEENIEIALLEGTEAGEAKLLAQWTVSAEEIRPQSDYKLTVVQPFEQMRGHQLILQVRTGLESSRAFAITNVQPIERRISLKTVRGGVLLFVLVVLAGSILLAKRLDYARAWLVLGAVLAAAWLIVMPYARVPDEEAHFFRIYEITQGHLRSEERIGESGRDLGRYMPRNLDLDTRQHYTTFRDVIDHRNLQLDRANEVWYSFPNMALYSPVSYLPQVIGVKLADVFTGNVLWIIYAGRLAGLLTALLLFYYALKRLPVKKECMFLIAMLPMVFQEMVSLSADSFINALAVFTTGFCLSLLFEEGVRQITPKELCIIWVLAPLIGLCKVVYLPLCLLFFLIPARMFGSRRKKIFHTLGPTALAVTLNAVWMAVADVGGSASGEQTAFILHYPFAFLMIAYRSLLTFGHDVLMELMGSNMGGLNIAVDELPLLLLLGLTVVLAAAPQRGQKRIGTVPKLVMSLVWLMILAMTWGSMYLGYNETANYLITGFQGRYLIPIAFFMLVTLESGWFERGKADLRKYLYPLAVSGNLYVLLSVLEEMTW